MLALWPILQISIKMAVSVAVTALNSSTTHFGSSVLSACWDVFFTQSSDLFLFTFWGSVGKNHQCQVSYSSTQLWHHVHMAINQLMYTKFQFPEAWLPIYLHKHAHHPLWTVLLSILGVTGLHNFKTFSWKLHVVKGWEVIFIYWQQCYHWFSLLG